jgi:hypothetical protein
MLLMLIKSLKNFAFSSFLLLIRITSLALGDPVKELLLKENFNGRCPLSFFLLKSLLEPAQSSLKRKNFSFS